MNFFITGGSRGIGNGLVCEAISQGHDVALTYRRDHEKANALVSWASAVAPGQKCKAYRLDVRRSAEVEEVGNRVLDEFGRIDVVVANAGVNINSLLVSMSDEVWQEVIETNLNGAFYVSRHFLPVMMKHRFGRIIMMSSVLSRGSGGQAAYCASKAALGGLSGTIAREYARKGVTCNVVRPSYFETDMTRGEDTRPKEEMIKKYNPVGRPGQMAELTKVVMFLASKEASYINGTEIQVDGGMDWFP